MLDNIPLRPFKSDVKLIADEYPLKVLCVEVNPTKDDILSKSATIEKLINVFYELDVAHNVVLVRSAENKTR